MICIENGIAVLLVAVILALIFFMYGQMDQQVIVNVPRVQETIQRHDEQYPLSSWIPRWGSGKVGYLSRPDGGTAPLFLQRLGSRYYYSTRDTTSDVMIPIGPKNGLTDYLQDDAAVDVNGTACTVQTYQYPGTRLA